MIERGAMSEQPGTPNGETPADPTENRRLALEQRVRRLEDAVATLQDTGPLEERIVERVARRLNREPAAAAADSNAVFKAGRQLLPAALDLIRTKTADAERQAAPAAGNVRRPWLLFDAYAELRTMVRMFFDLRYRPTWTALIVPLVLLVLIITSEFWLPGTNVVPMVVPVLGKPFMVIVDKVIDVALAFLAFKILNREARRYRELVADLPALPRS
jgi:hypothetical protein